MTYRKNHNIQTLLWMASAMAAPLVQAGTQCTWPVVLTAGIICLIAVWLLGGILKEPGPLLRLVQSLWICIIVSELLHWSAAVWPGHENPWAAPLIILLLACWLTKGRGSETARAGCVLLWPVVLLLGTVLLSAIPDVKGENLAPSWQWKNYHLITVMLVFPLCTQSLRKGGGKTMLALLLLGAASAVATAGVLSYEAAIKHPSPVYELSRSISLFGITERVESLTAAAMTIGFFASVSYLLEYTKGSLTGNRTWVYGLVSAALYLAEIRFKSIVLALGTVVLWIILPAFTGRKNKS